MKDLKKAYRTSVIIHNAVIASLFIYMILAEVIRQQFEPFEGFVSDFDFPLLRYALYALAVIQYVIIRKIRGILLKNASFDNKEEAISRLSRTSIITSALCEVPAIYGLILFLLGGSSRDFYILLIWSGVLFFLCFPRYSNWERWARSVMSM